MCANCLELQGFLLTIFLVFVSASDRNHNRQSQESEGGEKKKKLICSVMNIDFQLGLRNSLIVEESNRVEVS